MTAKVPTSKSQSRRIAIVVAAVFLLMIGLIFRLVYLQVFEHQQYLALAEGQHKTSYELLPERGKIFIQDNALVASSSLYPIAVNKEFALIYAIPNKILEVEEAAEKLYEFFKRSGVEKEVEAALKKEQEEKLKNDLKTVEGLPDEERAVKETEIEAAHTALLADPLYVDLQKQKREDLIREKREEIIKKYIETLSRSGDIYAPLERKLNEDALKNFYIFMSGRDDLTVDNLEMKDDKIFFKEDQQEFIITGFGYSMVPYRLYPENNVGSHILGFAGYENEQQRGHYGLEGFFDEELFGSYGSVTAERGAGGLVIINDRKQTEKEDGSNLILTIDRSAQFTACQLLDQAVAKHGAGGGSVIVVDPKTGAILVMCSEPDFDPNNYQSVGDIKVFNNPAVFAQYEPGSVFKAITMAAALDQEKVTPETTYVDKGQIMISGWPKPISNSDFSTHGGHGTTTMVGVLENSLNTGAIFAMQQVGAPTFANYVQKFGFGEKTGIELEAESAGDIRNIISSKVKEISAATASFGQGITVTPLQMVMSYAAIANGGELMKPYIVKEIVRSDGQRSTTQSIVVRRVISERTASILSGMLVNVVEEGHSKGMQISGYYLAGKTGTAQVANTNSAGYSNRYEHTFVGFAPATNASFVILTKLYNPRATYAESTAVPLAHDITKFLLNHWQIKQNREVETSEK